MGKLRLVLDSNEYIFHLDNRSVNFQKLLMLDNVEIFLNDLIFKEVIRNLRKDLIISFINLLKSSKFNMSWEKMPQEIIEKYKRLGLKKGDVIIASFCDFVNANYLISENRHFLKSSLDKTKILSLKEFMEKLI